MNAEIFKIEIPRQTFVFLSARTGERLQVLGHSLGEVGGKVIGPQAYALSADLTPEAIRDALGSLEDGECAYLIGVVGGAIESRLIVPPRM